MGKGQWSLDAVIGQENQNQNNPPKLSLNNKLWSFDQTFGQIQFLVEPAKWPGQEGVVREIFVMK